MDYVEKKDWFDWLMYHPWALTALFLFLCFVFTAPIPVRLICEYRTELYCRENPSRCVKNVCIKSHEVHHARYNSVECEEWEYREWREGVVGKSIKKSIANKKRPRL